MAALARVERTDFLSPVCIGEVANVSAEITYTSRRSVEVQVNVMSENILTGGWLPAPRSQNSRNSRDKPRARGSDPILRPPSPGASGRGEILPFYWGRRGGAALGREAEQAPWGLRLCGSFLAKNGKIHR